MDPKEIQKMVEELLKKNKYHPGKQREHSNIFAAYADYVSLIAERMEQVGVGFTIAQTAFHAMNPFASKIYNPATPFGPPPGGVGFVTDSLDQPSTIGSVSRELRQKIDFHKLQSKTYERDNKELNIYNGDRTSFKNEIIEIQL